MNLDKNNIVKSGFYSIIQILAATLSYVVIYFIVIYQLGKAQLGIWSVMMAVPAALTFLGSGVSGCILRYMPIYHTAKEHRELNSLVFNGVILNLTIALCIVCPGVFFARQILGFIFSITQVPDFYFGLFYISLTVFLINFVGSVFLSALDGLQLMQLKNKLLIAASLFVCCTAVVLVRLSGIKGLFYAQLAQAVFVIFSCIFLLYKTKLFKRNLFRLEKKTLRLFTGYGLNFQFISIFSLFFEPITKYFLTRYFNLSIVGTFDIANRIVLQARLFIVNAIQVIVPVVTKQNEQNKLNTQLLYYKALRGAIIFSITGYGLLISATLSFAGLIMKTGGLAFTMMIILLSAAQVFNILSTPGYLIMLGLGKLKIVLNSHIMSTVLNLVFFAGLKYYSNAYILVLPVFLATTISSVYITIAFRKAYINTPFHLFKEDRLLLIISLIFPVICVFTTNHTGINYASIAFLTIQAVAVLLLLLKNTFIRDLIAILLKRLPVQHGA